MFHQDWCPRGDELRIVAYPHNAGVHTLKSTASCGWPAMTPIEESGSAAVRRILRPGTTWVRRFGRRVDRRRRSCRRRHGGVAVQGELDVDLALGGPGAADRQIPDMRADRLRQQQHL